MKSLQDKTIVLTRPLEQARNLTGLLQAAGATVIVFPTLVISAYPNQQPLLSSLQSIQQFDSVIFISHNAVTYTLAQWRPPYPPTLKIFAVGAATAAALRAGGFLSVITPPHEHYSSEALLALPELQTIAHQKILIFSGSGGRTLLADTLRARGAAVTQIPVYQRSCPALDATPLIQAWQESGIDAIISTSNESLQNLYNLAGTAQQPWLQMRQLVVISQRMAQFALTLGFTRPAWVAQTASDNGILNALSKHILKPV